MEWNKYKRGVFHVIVLAIVHRKSDNKILIVRRKPTDPHVKKLTWQFPGGALDYGKELTKHLKDEVKAKTGLTIGVKKIIHARPYAEKKEFLGVYYSTIVKGDDVKLDRKSHSEYKWINPTEITKYFTTSYGKEILDFLRDIEK